jgi:hypothetical protein
MRVQAQFGGVYIDNDVECYRSMESSLQGLDLALNCELEAPPGKVRGVFAGRSAKKSEVVPSFATQAAASEGGVGVKGGSSPAVCPKV